jgi:FtsP/CotA-like multicopper oxidase with cupredoxin domain
MDRREMIKVSLASGAALLLAAEGSRLSAESKLAASAVNHPTGGVFNPPSPAVMNPFTQDLHRMQKKEHLPGGEADLEKAEHGGVRPNGTVYPQVTGEDALTTYANSLERIVARHQRNSGNNKQFPPQKFYVLRAQQSRHVFHPASPYSDNGGSIIWGYDGKFPGPTFESRYGEPILVRIFNDVFFDPQANPTQPGQEIPGGFGDPLISTHLHNGHTGSESDGNPSDIYPPVDPAAHLPQYPESIRGIKFRDHHYAMFRAGLDPQVPATQPPPNRMDGDPAETVSTLWYHDHSMDHTAENVYKGLVGFHLLFDEVDSGNENDPNPKALRLPSGEFDVPLLLQDKRFAEDGQLFLPDLSSPSPPMLGILGDRFTVNGQIQPRLKVKRRKYRFRILNAGPSRFYQLFLTTGGMDQAMIQIGNDQSLLDAPYHVPVHDGVLVSVAERADIVIDFKDFATGDKLFLVNRLVMEDEGFGPVRVTNAAGDVVNEVLPEGEGDELLCFEVGEAVAEDPSRLPMELRPNPALPAFTNLPSEDLKGLPNHRLFKFELLSGDAGDLWVVNGRPFDPSPAGATILPDNTPLPAGSLPTPRMRLAGESSPDGEVWTIQNFSSNWAHPVHIHLEEFRILRRNNKEPPPYERCKKDVLRLDANEEVQIFIRFRDFLGKYPIHCHNVLHEDHEMMVRFDVVGDY